MAKWRGEPDPGKRPSKCDGSTSGILELLFALGVSTQLIGHRLLETGSLLVGPFVINQIVNPSAVHLKLPSSLNMHPTFHIFQIKPVSESYLIPPISPLLLPHVIEGGLAYTVRRILSIRWHGCGLQYLSDW